MTETPSIISVKFISSIVAIHDPKTLHNNHQDNLSCSSFNVDPNYDFVGILFYKHFVAYSPI